MKRLLAVLFVSVAALISIGASCGGGSDTPSPDGGQPGTGSRVPGVLRIGGPDPRTLDPATTTDAGSALYIEHIFGGLLTLEPGGETVTVEYPDGSKAELKNVAMAPDIAEAIPSPVFNTDGTVSYTFRIRTDVSFHNGRQVKAQDFVYSWDRAANPDTFSSTAELYLGDIVGALDVIRGRADHISGVEALDDLTLRVTIDAPRTYFLWKLTYPTSFVVDSVQTRGNPPQWWEQAIGTGPFTLAKFERGTEIVLEANPNYHLGASKLKRVVLKLGGGSALAQYERGELDVTGVDLNTIDRVRNPSDSLHKELIETDVNELSTFYIGFNTEKPPFDDVKVRQAFGMTVDVEALARVVMQDTVVPARSIVPPGMPGYEPPTEAALPYDPAKARELLASSRYAGKIPAITLVVPGQGASAGDVINVVVDTWRQELGVTVTIEQREFGTFLTEMEGGRYQMFSLGWIADYPDPQDFLDIKFNSKYSNRNRETRYQNAEVDRLLEQAGLEQDSAKRAALYRSAERIILEEAPWIPLYHPKDIVLVKPYVKGYSPQPFVVPIFRFIEVQ